MVALPKGRLDLVKAGLPVMPGWEGVAMPPREIAAPASEPAKGINPWSAPPKSNDKESTS
jgi:hypothetical protein